MKIFVLSFDLQADRGGIQSYTVGYAKALSESHEVKGYSYFPMARPHPIRLLRRFYLLDRFFLALRLGVLLRLGRYDRLIVTHLHLSGIASLSSRIAGVEWDLFLIGTESWGSRLAPFLPLLGRARKFYSLSAFTTKQILGQGIEERKIVYVPPLVDFSRFPSIARPPRSGCLRLLTVGRMDAGERYKGHETVLRAVARLRERGVEVRYEVVGSGNDRERLMRLSRDLGTEESVHFHGFVESADLPRFYGESDLFIMPSRISLEEPNVQGEGFGIVFVEAGAAGLASIGPRGGGSDDIIQDGLTGWRVDPDDLDEIVGLLERLSREPHLCREAGTRAREAYRRLFDVRNYPEYLRNILED